jgi:hypothetical protein
VCLSQSLAELGDVGPGEECGAVVYCQCVSIEGRSRRHRDMDTHNVALTDDGRLLFVRQCF